MDQHHVVALARLLTTLPSRRDVLRGLVAAGLGLGVAQLPAVAANEKRKCKHKRPKPRPNPTPNPYGCLDVGAACVSAGQCCSGRCQGKKGKRTCRAHHMQCCTALFDACDEPIVGCLAEGHCYRTTGQGSFCGAAEGAECEKCAKDADCEPTYGPGAACVVCTQFCYGVNGSSGTACFRAAT